MNRNIVSMLIYFAAAGLLFAFAFTNNSFFLYGGIACLVVAIIFSRFNKKK